MPINGPTPAGFQDFITNVMGINALDLPLGSAVQTMAYNVAIALGNRSLCILPNGIYALAVYNLAGSQLIQFAQDQTGRDYFTKLRAQLKVNEFVPGVVGSTSDQGSATGLLNQEFMKTLTMQNLQNLKDPYGRQYLAFAQDYGPTIVGLS